MTLLDFSFPLPSHVLFDKTVARDWYDGLTSGIAKSSQLGAAFRFDIVAWGPSQEERVFALSSLENAILDKIVELLQGQEVAKWPIWRSVETAQASEVRHLLAKAGYPQYAIASDSMFTTLLAAREFNSFLGNTCR